MIKHTLGPWNTERRKSYIGVYSGRDIQGRRLQICACHFPHDHAEANARLIAAAPELLTALQYARNLIGPDEILDAAIAKAEGRT